MKAERAFRCFLSLALGVCVQIGCARSTRAPLQGTESEQAKLGDGFATAALLALKAIQRDPYAPAGGSDLVSRFTQEKIDAADVVAKTNEERNVAAALNGIYRTQLGVNQVRAKFENDKHSLDRLDSTLYSETEWKALCDAWGKIMVQDSSRLKALREPLTACLSDFDASLRARSTALPASCTAEVGAAGNTPITAAASK
jgi:hypothetical protein